MPLYSRVGTGYVYSSKFRSEDEARAEFFAHLRANGDLPADAPDPDTRVIKMRVGRTRRSLHDPRRHDVDGRSRLGRGRLDLR